MRGGGRERRRERERGRGRGRRGRGQKVEGSRGGEEGGMGREGEYRGRGSLLPRLSPP